MPAQTLPQLASDSVYLTDGGLETTLVFLDGLDLPDFAAFPLLDSDDGRAHVDRYFTPYLDIAERPAPASSSTRATWRANPDWGARLGYDDERARRGQPAGRRVRRRAGRDAAWSAGRARRRDRSARRRLRGRRDDDGRRGGRLPLAPGTGLRRGRRADDDRRHDDVRRRGGRGRRGGDGGRPAGGGLLHRRDRRRLPSGQDARRRDRRGRRGDRRRSGVLHGQLRPPHPLRGRPRARGAVDGAGAGRSAPTPRR